MLCLKYGSVATASYGHSTPSGPTEDVLGVNRSGQLVSALASYNTTCGQVLQFFTRPKVQVRILPKGSPPLEIVHLSTPIFGGIGDTPEIVVQSIMVKALNGSIENLAAKAWFENTNPTHLIWGMSKSTLDAATGHTTISQSPRYVPLAKDDEVPVWIWCAIRARQAQEQLLLNMDPPHIFKLSDLKEPKHIDIDIEFVPVDKQPRKYRLNAKSWDELNLVERN